MVCLSLRGVCPCLFEIFPTRLARVVMAKVPVFFVPATPLLVLWWLDLQACLFAHCGRVCESFPCLGGFRAFLRACRSSVSVRYTIGGEFVSFMREWYDVFSFCFLLGVVM